MGCLQVLEGHEHFVYSIATLGSLIASCGEDKSVRLWDGSSSVTIRCPSVVWGVALFGNGDVAAACSDGVVRVFSADTARQVSSQAQAAYEESVSSQTIASQTVSGLDISKLKDESALSVPGTRDGEHKFVRVGNAADAYSWSASEGRWVKIGTVVDNP